MNRFKLIDELEAVSRSLIVPPPLTESEKPKNASDVLRQIADMRSKVFNVYTDKNKTQNAVDVLKYLQQVQHILENPTPPPAPSNDQLGQEYMDVLHLISSSEPLSEADQPKCEWDLLKPLYSIRNLIPGFYQQSQRLPNAKTLLKFLQQVEFFLRKSEESKAAPVDPIVVKPSDPPPVSKTTTIESKLELLNDPNNEAGYILKTLTGFECKIGVFGLNELIQRLKDFIISKDDSDDESMMEEECIQLDQHLSININVCSSYNRLINKCNQLIDLVFVSKTDPKDEKDFTTKYVHSFKSMEEVKQFVKQYQLLHKKSKKQ